MATSISTPLPIRYTVLKQAVRGDLLPQSLDLQDLRVRPVQQAQRVRPVQLAQRGLPARMELMERTVQMGRRYSMDQERHLVDLV